MSQHRQCDMVETPVFTRPNPSCPTKAIQKEERYDQLGCGLSTLESSSERIVDDLQSNVDDFLDVMMFLKQSLGEAALTTDEGQLVAPGVGGQWEVEFPYVMTFLRVLSSTYKMPSVWIRIGYSTHFMLTLSTMKGFVLQLRMRENLCFTFSDSLEYNGDIASDWLHFGVLLRRFDVTYL